MRIALLNITAGGMSGGYKKYLSRIIPGLLSHSKVSKLLVSLPKGLSLSVTDIKNEKLQWLFCEKKNPSSDRKMKKCITDFNPDVVFIPTGRGCSIKGVPLVTMIRNMEPLVFSPSGLPWKEYVLNKARYLAAKEVAKKSDFVIAPSLFVKKFLREKWQIIEERIGVVYHGVQREESAEVIRPKGIPSGWDSKFIFTAGSVRPARGLEDVITAMRNLHNNPSLKGLVIGGEVIETMIKYWKKLKTMIKSANIDGRVILLGKLSEAEMSWCYRNCALFVMTSRVEACPNIALEALANGCLNIAAFNEPLPEIFAGNCVYYGPGNAGELTTAIEDVISWDTARKERCAQKAKIRALSFSWESTIEKTVLQLERAIDSCFERNKRNNKNLHW